MNKIVSKSSTVFTKANIYSIQNINIELNQIKFAPIKMSIVQTRFTLNILQTGPDIRFLNITEINNGLFKLNSMVKKVI